MNPIQRMGRHLQPLRAADDWQGEADDWFSRYTRVLPILCALCLIALAGYQGYQATYGLSWPYDPDAFRDIAQAQVILDGVYPADYAYKGESLWYNPLTGFLIAGYAKVTGLPAYEANMQLGVWLNLAVPAAFFLLVAVWFDTWTALAALVSFLFLVNPDRPTFASASYSPWLFAPHITQALFYVTLLTCAAWLNKPRWNLAVLGGILLGLTFLGHTAPAVLAGGIAALVVCVRMFSMPKDDSSISRGMFLRGFGIMVLAAFIVSLPFSGSILFRYSLDVTNSAAANWVYEEVSKDNLSDFLGGTLVLSKAVAAFGAYALWLKSSQPGLRLIVLAWGCIGAVFLANGYLAQMAGDFGAAWPQITPGYHYLLYLSALKHVLFGVGVVFVCRLFTPVFLAGIRGCSSHIVGWTQTAVGLCCLGVVGWSWGDYQSWRELEPVSLNASASLSSNANPYFWIREHADGDDVFLCEDVEALHMVAPAGAKVVALEQTFSHIYLDWQVREVARRDMFWELEMGEADAFRRLVSEYEVTHVLLGSATDMEPQDWWSDEMSLEFESPMARIYRVNPE